MRIPIRPIAVTLFGSLLFAACSTPGATTAPSADASAAPSAGVGSAAPSAGVSAAPGGTAPVAPSGDPIVIGFPADLSSTYAYYDQPMLEGAQFAVDEINDAGGVLGRPLKLEAIDIRNDPAETSKVTQKFIDDGVVYLVGTTGDGISAEGALACQAGIPVSTGDGTAATLVGDIGPCAFQVLMNDTIQGAIAADYALAQNYKTAVLVGSPEIPYTKNLPGYFAEVFTKGGGTVTEETYQIDAGDYSAVATKIANLNPQPDVIYTPMFPPDTQIFMRQLRQAGVTTPVISSDGNLDPSLTSAGAAAIDGMVFTAAVCPADTDTAVGDFFTAYNTRYGADPSSVVATLGYDEIKIVAQAIETAGSAEPAKITEALSNFEYSGVSGDSVMDPETRRVKKPAALIQMEGETFTCLEQPGYPTFVPNP
ncbi:MAG: ABC transporter substrate-binding protein [Chloroflexi bacterium]|nr:ABC transporter substrate-binding protein [Chloroflexota bacterium]